MFRMFGCWKRVIGWDLGAESKCYPEGNALIRRNPCSLQMQLCAAVILQKDSVFFEDTHLLKSAYLLCGSMYDYVECNIMFCRWPRPNIKQTMLVVSEFPKDSEVCAAPFRNGRGRRFIRSRRICS